jgi:hypothetical protein
VVALLAASAPFLAAFAFVAHERNRERALALEVEEEERIERAPITRPVLRGKPTSGDALAAVASGLAFCPALDWKPGTRVDIPDFGEVASNSRMLETRLVDMRTAPATVAWIRSQLQCEQLSWMDPERIDFHRSLDVAATFVLMAKRAWEEEDGLESAEVLLDLLRFLDDAARLAPPFRFGWVLGVGSHHSWIDSTLVGLLSVLHDPGECDEIAREARILEETFPSAAESVRRERVELHRRFLDYLRRRSDGALALGRALTVRRDFAAFDYEDGTIADLERIVAQRPHAASSRVRERLNETPRNPWDRPDPRITLLYEGERLLSTSTEALASLRAIEVLARAKSEKLRTGRWPESADLLELSDGSVEYLDHDGSLKVALRVR